MQGSQINILENAEQSQRNHISSVQNLLRRYSTQNDGVLTQQQKHNSPEQNKESEKQSHVYRQLIFKKGAKAIQQRKDSLVKKSCFKTIENPWVKKNEL